MRTRRQRKGTRIETRRTTLRPIHLTWALGYAVAWMLLVAVSSPHWFLPAGLRLAVLWLLPRRYWWAMGATEVATVLALGAGRLEPGLPFLVAAVLPWAICALLVRLLARPLTYSPTPDTMARFLMTGVYAALGSGLAHTLAAWLAHPASDPKALGNGLFGFTVGELIGIVIVSPLVRLVYGQYRGNFVPWRSVLGNGLVLAPVLLMGLIHLLPLRDVTLYPLVLSAFPLLAVAFRHGWRASAISMFLLAVAAHLMADDILLSWRPGQMQLLIAAIGFAGLTLGVSTDSLRTQGRALQSSIGMLSSRTQALADATNRIVSQQEDERARIGSDLHDQIGQDMTAIATRLRLVERATDDPQLRGALRDIGRLVGEAHEHLRTVIQSLHPLELGRFGLRRALAEGALRDLAADHGIDFDCRVEGPVDSLPQDVATAVYRICQEVTTNCARHGCGGRLGIRLTLLEQHEARLLALVIDDDGGAFQLPNGTGHGLQNIRDRANAIGAAYVFDPTSGHPRHALTVRIPGPPPENSSQPGGRAARA